MRYEKNHLQWPNAEWTFFYCHLLFLTSKSRCEWFAPVFRIRIHFLRIRIQRLRLETNTDPDTDPNPIRFQGFNDQIFKKNYSWKKNYIFSWSKTAIYLSLGLHKVCPGYRRSLQLTKEAIQHFKTWIFSPFVGHFCPPGSGSGFRIRIGIHWPDWIRIQTGSGSRSGSETLVCTFVICAVVLKKPQFLLFSMVKGGPSAQWIPILRSYLNWWHNWQLKSSRRSHTLKGSHSMEDGRIFLKTRRDVSFNKVLSNEPNFARIHLAKQYL